MRQKRLALLATLIAEMQLRDMQIVDVVALLHCSDSAARSYMNELLDAALVSSPNMLLRPAERHCYRLSCHMEVIDNFLNSTPRLGDALPGRSRRHAGKFGLRHFHILSGDVQFVVKISNLPVARDPLVAAFFG